MTTQTEIAALGLIEAQRSVCSIQEKLIKNLCDEIEILKSVTTLQTKKIQLLEKVSTN
jgi:hypothetical protein